MNFFSELQRITAAYCEINGLPVAKSLLCSDSELERIKETVNAAPQVGCVSESSNAIQSTTPAVAASPISAPRTAKEWREYGKNNPNW